MEVKTIRASEKQYLLVIAMVIVVTALGASFSARWHRRAAQEALTTCRSNIKDISTACEMYACDYSGRYPFSLASLSPEYLPHGVPTCPRHLAPYRFASASNPDACTLVCEGSNHLDAGLPRDEPHSASYECGLIER